MQTVPERSTTPAYADFETRIQYSWYALYTCANREKRVADQLDAQGIEHFLPCYDSLRRWKDRKVRLSLPLFPGYVFVHLPLRNRVQVLQVPGAVKLVGFNGQPAALPEGDIETLRLGLGRELGAEPHPFLKVGRRVRVRSGPFEGLLGILTRRKSKTRLVISLELIMRAIAVEVDESDLEPV